MEERRICRTCKVEKGFDSFPKDKACRGGIRTQCRDCKQKKANLWRRNNPDKIKASVVRQLEKRPTMLADYREKYRERFLEKRKEYYLKNKEVFAQKRREWRKNNPEKNREKNRRKKQRYNLLYPEKERERKRRYQARRRLRDSKYRLHCRISNSIRKALKGNKRGRKWESLVGYTCEQLKKHLEKQFLAGMSWDNMGEWHIDHIIPRDVFNYETTEDIDFHRCWALKNLRPLWATDNMKKSNKIDKHFQPSLVYGNKEGDMAKKIVEKEVVCVVEQSPPEKVMKKVEDIEKIIPKLQEKCANKTYFRPMPKDYQLRNAGKEGKKKR